jgi:hypothetical protein
VQCPGWQGLWFRQTGALMTILLSIWAGGSLMVCLALLFVAARPVPRLDAQPCPVRAVEPLSEVSLLSAARPNAGRRWSSRCRSRNAETARWLVEAMAVLVVGVSLLPMAGMLWLLSSEGSSAAPQSTELVATTSNPLASPQNATPVVEGRYALEEASAD